MSRKLKLTSNLRALMFTKQNLKVLAVGMIYFNFPKDCYVYSETTRTTSECLCDVSPFEFKRLRSNYSSHLKRSWVRMSYLPYSLKNYMKLALFSKICRQTKCQSYEKCFKCVIYNFKTSMVYAITKS